MSTKILENTMIDRRTIFEIYRLRNEGLSERRIANNLLIDPKTVAKYLENPNPPKPLIIRASKMDPFKEEIDRFIHHLTVTIQQLK